jgi:hypothetical protein
MDEQCGAHTCFLIKLPCSLRSLVLTECLIEWVLQVESTWPVTYVMGFQRVSFKQSGPSHRMV